MLGFFRRYQKLIFIVITVMVIISFTFFGTSQSLMPSQTKAKRGELLFSVQKRKVYTNYFDQMVHFLDIEPSFCADPFKIIDLNPLNDGVISHDFLAPQLLSSVLLGSEFSSSFFSNHTKEKEYKLFSTGDGKFSMISIWENFSPQLKQSFQNYCSLNKDSPFSELVEAKADLALAHQRTNGEMMKSFLRYFSMQSSGKELSIPNDLSLFGYHTWSDWFGKKSIEEIAKVIIYGAESAKKKGLKVSKEEVVEDLFRKSCICLNALKERGNIALNEQQFFQFIISRSGIDHENLLQIWEDVLYFRRGMDLELSSVILDAHALESFSGVANQSVTVKGTGMGEGLKFQDEKDWMEFEIYLDAIGCKREDLLSLPTRQKELDLIAINTPDLCGKRYLFQVRKVEKEQLRAKVAVQELRRWQRENLALLSSFGITKEKDLEKLDSETLVNVDNYSYGQIIDMHPEWVEEALSKKDSQPIRWFCSFGEKSACLEGMDNLSSFADLIARKEKIDCYTQDQQHYYRIERIEEEPIEVLSFQEAKQKGVLKKLYETGRYQNLQKNVQDTLSRYLMHAGFTIPLQKKEQFLAQHRFIKQLQADVQLNCFDQSFLPNQFYETVDRSHPDFSKIKMLQSEKKQGFLLKNRGFVFLEKQEELTDSSASFTKLKQLHQLVTLDLRKKLVKEIVEGIKK